MNARLKASAGAYITAVALFYLAAIYVDTIVAANEPPDALAPWLSLGVFAVVAICFLDWLVQRLHDARLSGLIIGISQVLLVDVYYPLSGQRAWLTALVSALVLVVGWGIVGTVYGVLLGDGGDASAG